MNNPTAREYIDKALSLACKRHQTMSENSAAAALEPMYGSGVEQLSYLHNIVGGSESDKNRIAGERIICGFVAEINSMRTFEPPFERQTLTEEIKSCYIAEAMKKTKHSNFVIQFV
ncbi:hypothetical protein SAMN04487787_10925 [Kosakonia sacchari]|nr:hypothetical protein SAMN04487787_10925 [Kosakonia sacchari]